MPIPRPPFVRFRERVRLATDLPWHGGQPCWQWTARTERGYGRITLLGGRRLLAHRFSWEHHRGPVPDGLQLDHLCRNRSCVNPAHLEPVTSRENTLRGDTIPARHAAKTHCDNGHEFTDENTYRYKGNRHCRKCVNERSKRYYARVKAKAA